MSFLRQASMAVWTGATWAILTASAIVISALVFRRLGDAHLGIWATIAVLRGLLALVDTGLAPIVTRDATRVSADDAARDRIGSARTLYAASGVAVLVLGVVGSGVPGFLLALSGEAAGASAMVTVIMATEGALALFGGTYPSLVRARERFDVLAIGAALQATASVGIAIAAMDALGLVGVALGTLTGRVVWLVASYLWLRTNAPELLVRSGTSAVPAVLGATVPLWVTLTLAEAAIRLDVPIVGAFFGPAPAAHYALGAALPTLSVGLLYVVVDTAYPRISAEATRGRPPELAPILPIACALAALGFTVLTTYAPAYLTVWVGAAPPLAIMVAILYSLTWLANVPAHVLMLVAIARNAHRVVAPIQVGEAATNLALSVLLTALGTPLGPAIATLATLAVSNLLIVPAVLLPRLGLSRATFATYVVGSYALGAVAALPVVVVTSLLGGSPLATAIVALGGAAACGAAIAVLVHRFARARQAGPIATRPSA